MSTAALSVIVTTHLRPNYLDRALKSLTLLGERVQIVLCSDECTKDTFEVASRNLRSMDIFVATPGLKGPAETRNLGLKLATANYISFLDDDDTLSPTVAKIMEAFDGKTVFFTNYRKVFEKEDGTSLIPTRVVEKSTSRKSIDALLVRNFLHIGCFFVPKQAAAAASFRTDLSSSEDWEYLLQIHGSASFSHIDEYASNWHLREDDDSRDSVTKKTRALNTRQIYDLHPVDDSNFQRQREKRLSDLDGGAK